MASGRGRSIYAEDENQVIAHRKGEKNMCKEEAGGGASFRIRQGACSLWSIAFAASGMGGAGSECTLRHGIKS